MATDRSEYFREYNKRNAERQKAYQAEYVQKNADRIRERKRLYRKENATKIKATRDRYRENNEEQRLADWLRSMRYGSAVRETCPPTTLDELATLKKTCTVCGADAEEIDHIVPKHRGGCASLHNMQWLCANCNLRKYTKLMHEWLSEAEYWDWADRTHSGGCVHVESGE